VEIRELGGDGAAGGVKPSRALETILGGAPQPAEAECMPIAEFTAWILSVPDGEAQSYDDAARIIACAMLKLLAAHPAVAPMSASALGRRWQELDPESYKAMNERSLGPTAFQWGWAWNAVRAVSGLPTGANPAIVEIG
jgi:hypothetical protein